MAWMIDHLSPRGGQTILELGAGPGDTGFEVAKKLGAEGKLISSDGSPEMTEVAKRRIAKFGVDNVEFRVIDAQHIDMPDDSVDGILHKYGPMLMNDQSSYTSEVRRALRQRGRYVAAVWAVPEQNPWLAILPMALVQSGVEMPQVDLSQPGGPLSLGEPDVLGTLIAGAGFGDVVVEPVGNPMESETFDGLWATMSELAGPLAAKIMTLPEEKVEVVRENLRTVAEPYRSGDGYRIPGQALCVSAR